MPKYKLGGQTVRRKNWYHPCALGPKFDTATDEELAELLKKTAWADRITSAVWEALLGHDGCSPSAKSRLKRKTAETLMMLGRIAVLNPELFERAVADARAMYEEQTGQPYPWAHIAPQLAGLEDDPDRPVVEIRLLPRDELELPE